MIEREEGCTYMDGYDDCLIGHCQRIGQPLFALYSVKKLVERHMADGMSYQDALDFIDYNQLGAYVGETTPGFVVIN